MRIAVENSTWNNIGDAIYQLSLENYMRSILPSCTIYPFDGPPVRSWRPSRWIADNVLDIRVWQDADLYILSGPILDELTVRYRSLIETIKKRGARYAMVSVGACEPVEGEKLSALTEFFAQFPPDFATTRDPNVYAWMREMPFPVHDGICTAFLSPETIPFAPIVRERDYLCCSFHRMPEPKLVPKSGSQSNDRVEDRFEVVFESRKPMGRWSRMTEFLRSREPTIREFDIFRPHHGIALASTLLQFPTVNSFASFHPANYLSLYSETTWTVTDRVHAAAVTLALGRPAILTIDAYRNGIFKPLLPDFQPFKTFRLDPQAIAPHRELMSDFIQQQVFT